MHIRDANARDAAAIAAIYNPFVRNSAISFEEAEVSADAMQDRMADVQAANLPWLVACVNDVVIGYAYATKWRVRHAYRFSVETSVYIDGAQSGLGRGTALYTAFLQRLRLAGCHLAIGGIALPNVASVALHEKMGYRKAAHFEEVGFKFGRWHDVGYWQCKL